VIAVQNVQTTRRFQYKIFRQYGDASTKCSDNMEVPVQNVQTIWRFQYKLFRQQGYSRTNYSVNRNGGWTYMTLLVKKMRKHKRKDGIKRREEGIKGRKEYI
jgi:hypothetical protein